MGVGEKIKKPLSNMVREMFSKCHQICVNPLYKYDDAVINEKFKSNKLVYFLIVV